MEKAYMVIADNRETYEQHRWRVVAVYTDEEEATVHADAASEWVKAKRFNVRPGMNPYDHQWEKWEYHMLYEVRTVPLLSEFGEAP